MRWLLVVFSCPLILLTVSVASAGMGGGTTSPPPPSGAEESSTTPPESTSSAYDSSADQEGADDDRGGLYMHLVGMGMFALESTHEWADTSLPCAAVSIPLPNGSQFSGSLSCSARSPIGVGGGGRLGYSFGALGLEGFLLGAADWSRGQFAFNPALPPELQQSLSQLPAPLQDMQIGRVGGALGGGLRLMTPRGAVRLSLGAGGGVALRHVYTSFTSLDSTVYVAPMATADLSLTLFGFLSLGVMGWVEFLSEDVAVQPDFTRAGPLGAPLQTALGPITVFQGPQVFIGPQLGLHLGG